MFRLLVAFMEFSLSRNVAEKLPVVHSWPEAWHAYCQTPDGELWSMAIQAMVATTGLYTIVKFGLDALLKVVDHFIRYASRLKSRPEGRQMADTKGD